MTKNEIPGKVKEVLNDFIWETYGTEIECEEKDELILTLRLDSLDLIELQMELEEKYKINISDEEAKSLVTVEDVIKLVEKHTESL